MEQDTKPAAAVVELADVQALAPIPGSPTSGLSPIAHRADALQVIERQGKIFEAVQVAMLRLTTPEDWTVQKIDEQAFLTPSGTAVNKIRQYLALEVEILGRTPVERDVAGGKMPGVQVDFRCRSLVYGSLTGLPPEMVPWLVLSTTRWADEDFTGRKVDAEGKLVRRGGVTALSSDLAASGDSAARNRAFRQITGLDKVPVDVAATAWKIRPEQAIARAKKGYGFGSGNERQAQRVQEEGVGTGAQQLWEECLRQANGDVSAAGQILREITSYGSGKRADGSTYPAFAGVDTPQQITTEKSLSIAWKKVRARAQRQPGEDE